MPNSETYMKIAIEEAAKASWPFGAVIVRDGKVIAQAGAGDGTDTEHDPTAHAETNAIRRACEKLGTGDLSGAILYASCEPCALCFGAAWYANIKNIVYGSSLDDIKDINKAWGGDLAFPHDHIPKAGIKVHGGELKNEVMDMYASHPRLHTDKQ
ncbi:nucleoside deaminase [Candidatus Kaiserbacteria bacterium]|nr:MAG: nucleoside deaminase [Candidatus Kaiserbacteria bacterium]